jgi:hypothetical protein
MLDVVPVIMLAELQRDRHLAVVGVNQVHNRTSTTAAWARLVR